MAERYILYIGGNNRMQNHLQHNLKSIGFRLCSVKTIQKAGEMVLVKPFCSLILVPFSSSAKEIFGFCSFIHSWNAHTIVMVLMTKVRLHVEELLFDYGVDDVVVGRQTSSKLLAKRIQAHLREFNTHFLQNNTIRLKDAVIDFDRREVRRNGSCYQLRGILADLLKYFLNNPNRIISREELQESPIWSDSICTPAKEGGKTFDVTVGKLRKVIEPNPAKPQIIQSVRGIGWKLAIAPV